MYNNRIQDNGHSYRRNERGFTIMELIVAMTISSILAVLVFQFMAAQATRFNEKRQESEMQQELRWAMSFLYDHVRLAGNGVPPTCGWAAIEAVDGASGDPDSLTILGAFKSINVTITQQWGNAGAQEKLDNTEEIETGVLGVISDGTFSEIFMITSKTDSHVWHDTHPPWNDDKKLDHRYAAGSTIQIISYYSFFVDTDDEGRSNLMLKHQAYDPQILMGDVDDFQVRFKMKDNSWKNEPDPDEIYDIRVIEISLRAKSPEPLPNYIDPEYGDGHKRVEIKGKVVPQNIVII